MQLGQWYHVTVVYDSNSIANMPMFYINGVAYPPDVIFSSPLGSNVSDAALPLRIGGQGGIRFFDGTIDDVRIYNRALSPAEVQAIFNGT